MNENSKFYILVLKEEWLEESRKVLRKFSSDSQMSQLAENLKDNIHNELKQGKEEVGNTKKQYIEQIDKINENSKQKKGLLLEILLNYQYSKNVVFSRKNLTEKEVFILKDRNLLGYILPHKGTKNFESFLCLRTSTNPLIFSGESILFLLKDRISHIPDFEELSKFLSNVDNKPFVIIIETNKYLSLRDRYLDDNFDENIKK